MLTWFRGGKLHRVTADTCDGVKAQDKARNMMADFEAVSNGEVREVKTGKLLEEAIADFLNAKRTSGITEKHVAKLTFELEGFQTFALGRGLVNLGDVQTEHVLAYRNTLDGAQNTRAKKIFRLIGFFEFCVEMGWIVRNIARAQSVILKYDDQQTPKALNDAQFTVLMDAVQKLNGRTTDEQRRKLRSLLMLMRWTGLAIRDAVLIERARFEQNGNGFCKLFLRRAKTGHAVYATLKADVLKQVLAGANPNGRWLFVDGVPKGEKERDRLIEAWGVLFRKLGAVADLKDEHGAPYKFTSHSLRHSFVHWCLNSGLPTEDVAALIGDSVQIVARHYSEWIFGRQEKLTERMMVALA
jgi:site-specific recombinase XerD